MLRLLCGNPPSHLFVGPNQLGSGTGTAFYEMPSNIDIQAKCKWLAERKIDIDACYLIVPVPGSNEGVLFYGVFLPRSNGTVYLEQTFRKSMEQKIQNCTIRNPLIHSAIQNVLAAEYYK
jgi:hypothetical protein